MDKEIINTLIHKAQKIALGLPQTTSMKKLLAPVGHNTVEELHEAHKASKTERLKLASTGRDTLGRLGYRVAEQRDSRFKASPELKSRINVATLLRNMHPEHHGHRRQARTQALARHHGGDKNVRSSSSFLASRSAARSSRARASCSSNHALSSSPSSPMRSAKAIRSRALAIFLIRLPLPPLYYYRLRPVADANL
ncbi:hypothetical protein HPB50_014929 [Hyalomma asiaticum]|uniref:Uncharacterized protein n=1 Tax=Hyalomma asiaticum TaxID=266040 RepID=A0ACB7SBS4_HYAAI|nr:hypothetical protein HPB50_014929 [Hyalomma asiaticum]